jgi:hypothetical protein
MSKISFKRFDIFGKTFAPSLNSCFARVSNMLLTGTINSNSRPGMKSGTIDLQIGLATNRTSLWSYIYYLYFYNNKTNPVFYSMKNTKANAELFCKTIMSYLGTDKLDNMALTIFINKVINEYSLINPVIDYLDNIVKNKQVIPKLSEILIKDGVLTNNVKTADIKLFVDRVVNK